MKKLLLLSLMVFLSACQSSVEEAADAVPDIVEQEPQDEVGSAHEGTQEQPARTLFVTIEELPRVFVQNLATHRRPDFVNDVSEEELRTYQEVFFIYQSRSDLQFMFSGFELPELTPYQYEVRVVQTQRHIYLNPGAFVRQMDLFENLKRLDVRQEGVFDLPFSFPTLDLTRSIESFGSIAVITTALNDGGKVEFLPADRHVVFRDSDKALAQDFDTYIFMYEQNNDPNYPRNNFGQVLNPGEIIGIEMEGKTFILLRFSSNQRPELTQLRSNVLSLKGRVRIEEYLTLSRGLIFSPVGFVKNPMRIFDSVNIPFSPLDVCRVPQRRTFDADPPQSKGFPLRYNVVPPKGVVNVAFVAVDFPDVKGDPDLIDQWLAEIYTMEEWSFFMASGVMEYKVHFEPQWITAPREAKWYGCEACMRVITGNYEQAPVFRLQPEMEAINQVFTAADDYYDWSQMDFAFLMFPSRAEGDPYWVSLYSHGGNNRTPKAGNVFVPVYGKLFGWFAPEYTDYTMWDFATHEILHEQGLMGHGPYNGGNYSVMQDQHGDSKMLLSWEAFLLDWWNEDHLACIDIKDLQEPIIFEIDSLDQNGIIVEGPKNLMIRLNHEEIIVIEYRTDGPFSTLPKEFQGIMAYHVNVNQPQFRCDQGCEDLTIEEYEAKNFWRYLRDSTRNHPCLPFQKMHQVYGDLYQRYCNQSAFVHSPGAVITYENLKISVLHDNVVEIERIHS